MSFRSSIRSGARPPLDQDRWSDASTSPPTGPAEADAPLPRHILVALAAIAADVTSLRQRSADEPQLHEPLGRILGRLDGLVDSIYDRAADTRAHPVDASSGHRAVITADHPTAASAVPVLTGERRDTGAHEPF